jgi:hypothetical protein
MQRIGSQAPEHSTVIYISLALIVGSERRARGEMEATPSPSALLSIARPPLRAFAINLSRGGGAYRMAEQNDNASTNWPVPVVLIIVAPADARTRR